MKRVWYVISGILAIILIVSASVFVIEYNKVKKNQLLLGEGLTFLRSGEYDAGLAKCNQMDYYQVICYSTLLGLKLGKNETITPDLCEGFVLETPFWEKGTSESIELMRETCDCMVQYNDKERCTNFSE